MALQWQKLSRAIRNDYTNAPKRTNAQWPARKLARIMAPGAVARQNGARRLAHGAKTKPGRRRAAAAPGRCRPAAPGENGGKRNGAECPWLRHGAMPRAILWHMLRLAAV